MIAIIAGNGTLPRVVASRIAEKENRFAIFCLETENWLFFNNSPFIKKAKIERISLCNIDDIIEKLTNSDVKQVVCCGGVKFPGLKNIDMIKKPWKMSKYLFLLKYAVKTLFSHQKGDNFLLTIAQNIFKDLGFELKAVQDIVPEIMCFEKDECNETLAKEHENDIQLGQKILDTLSPYDVGQAIVVQCGRVLGIEGVEGTAKLIERCGEYKLKKEQKPVLVKLCKIGQSMKLDVPTIGIETFKSLKKNGYSGVAIGEGSVILLDKEEVKEFCKKEDLFLKVL